MLGGVVTVNTDIGTFKLDLNNNYVNLIYLNQWMKINTNNISFYPTIKQTKIILTDYSPDLIINVSSRYLVSLSSDGNTLAIGGNSDNGSIGSTWVYTKSDNSWALQQKISPTSGDYTGKPQFGRSVSLSTDGNILAIGGNFDNSQIGAVWVYTRSGGSWIQQQKISPVIVGNNKPQFGRSVSLSSGGNTLAIGGNGDSSKGATWVYTRSGSTWIQQQKISTTDNIGNSRFGESVSLTSDGNTLAIGGYGDNTNVGATWVYTRSGGSWTKQTKIIPTDNILNSRFGLSLSLTSDGNTLAIGGYGDNTNVGATWVYI